MFVRSCGIHSTHTHGIKIDAPNGCGYYLFLRLKTPARFYIGEQVVDAAPNDIILYRKGAHQRFENRQAIPYIDDFLRFDVSGAEDEAFIEQLGLQFDQPLRLSHIHALMNIHQMICMEFIEQNQRRQDSLDCLLRYFLIKLGECMHANDAGTDAATLERFNELRLALYSSPAQRWTVADMANTVNLSPSYFQTVYKNLFHISCMADLIASRMTYARELLTTTALPIGEIAAKCGYDSNIYFSRHFKRKVGMTPSEYREQYHL